MTAYPDCTSTPSCPESLMSLSKIVMPELESDGPDHRLWRKIESRTTELGWELTGFMPLREYSTIICSKTLPSPEKTNDSQSANRGAGLAGGNVIGGESAPIASIFPSIVIPPCVFVYELKRAGSKSL